MQQQAVVVMDKAARPVVLARIPSPRRGPSGVPPVGPVRGRARSPSPAMVRAPVRPRSQSPIRPPSPSLLPPNHSPKHDGGEAADGYTPPRPIPKSPSSCGASDIHPARSLIFEKAVRWDYDFIQNKWAASAMAVRIDRQPFQKGSVRYAYHMVDDRGNRFVAKCRIKPLASNRPYFEDSAMQAACQHYALAYNRRGPPKAVSFVDTFVLQLTEREGRHFMACEEYLPGVYAKYNNNGGWTAEDVRNTPQAFSHFTYAYSQRKLIIVDIQGVGDRYTDPQLHSVKQRYGAGDLGVVGMQLFFQTHQCNSICRGLGLTDAAVGPNGTQMN